MRPLAALIALLAFAPAALAAPGDTRLVAAPDGASSGDSAQPSISSDGHWVAFASSDEDLSGSDAPGQDVFVREMDTGAFTYHWIAPGADPSISADGRFVAYESGGNVLRKAVGGGSATTIAAGTNPAISSDGRFVALESGGQIRRWDAQAGLGGNIAAGANPSISGDGSRIAFEFAGTVYRAVLDSTTTDTVGPGREPSISADGVRIAFESDDALVTADDNGFTDVYLWTAGHAGAVLMSRTDGSAGAVGDGSSEDASIAPDGSAVAFESNAMNFAVEDASFTGVFVRELAFEQTHLASRANGPQGAGADGGAGSPSLANALVVAFDADADNLSTGDDNAFSAVHRREIGGPPLNLSAPAISDSGGTLACSSGNWRWPVSSFSFTWRREGTEVGTGPSYAPGADDAGNSLTCDVTAANGAGATVASSPAFALAAADSGLLVLQERVTSPFASLSESFNGTARRDTLIGSVRANTIRGRGGNDLILGGGGDDRLYGDAGNDTVDGELGNDLVDGGAGADRLTGGDGRDRIVGRAGADRINSADGARDTIDCGKGRDRVTADRRDRVKGCERVKRRR